MIAWTKVEENPPLDELILVWFDASEKEPEECPFDVCDGIRTQCYLNQKLITHWSRINSP